VCPGVGGAPCMPSLTKMGCQPLISPHTLLVPGKRPLSLLPVQSIGAPAEEGYRHWKVLAAWEMEITPHGATRISHLSEVQVPHTTISHFSHSTSRHSAFPVLCPLPGLPVSSVFPDAFYEAS
jgi:hypothetical protein